MTEKWKPVILHVDMDAFFASVEQLLHPEWRGKPVIVGADPRQGKGRGVVSTASYEARKFGVHSAMPISRAYRLCPHGIFVQPHGNVYSRYSRQIMEILHQFTPLVEAISIDEAFLDVTGSLHLYTSVEELGKEIKRKIKQKTGLSASVGIAPSKSVAKIASDYQKPDGLTIVSPDQVQSFLDPLPISKIFGVGKKTHQALEHLGIKTVKDLRLYPEEALRQKFGKMGVHLYHMARGTDSRKVETAAQVKSVSNEITFNEDQRDPGVVLNALLALSEKVGQRLRKKGLMGKTVQLKIRFSDFSTHTRQKTLSSHTNLTNEIFAMGKHLFEEFETSGQAIRLIGIGTTHLINEEGRQLSLWDIRNEKKVALEKTMDALQKKFGKGAVTHADTLNRKSRQ